MLDADTNTSDSHGFNKICGDTDLDQFVTISHNNAAALGLKWLAIQIKFKSGVENFVFSFSVFKRLFVNIYFTCKTVASKVPMSVMNEDFGVYCLFLNMAGNLIVIFNQGFNYFTQPASYAMSKMNFFLC